MAQEDDSYTQQLKIENQNLVNEISKLENESNKYGRVNEYYVQDEVMLVYIQKMMSVLYAVIYFGFLYAIVISDRHIGIKILFAALFATLPFIVHIVTAYFYSKYLEVLEFLKIGTVTRV